MNKLKMLAMVMMLGAFFALNNDSTFANDGGGACNEAGQVCGAGIRCCKGLVCGATSGDTTIGTCYHVVPNG